MRTPLVLAASVLFTAAACVRAGGAADPASSAAPVAASAGPCTATVRGADVSTWQTVAARGFTFCVPAGWRRSGQTWWQGAASVTRGVGAYRPTAVATEVVTVTQGQPLPSRADDGAVRRFSEEIAARRAEMWRGSIGTGFHTGAKWTAPQMWLAGEAVDPTTADLQMVIYRTVQFTPPTGR